MPFQLSVAVRNAQADALESAIGPSPILMLRTGAVPGNTAAANTGTVVASIQLPSDWLTAAANGAKSKSGTWEDTSADAAGTIGHFRIYANDGTTCHWQGTVTQTGGGGDMTVDNPVAQQGQNIVISSFTYARNNG